MPNATPCRMRIANSIVVSETSPYRKVHTPMAKVETTSSIFRFIRSLTSPLKGRITMDAMEKAPVIAPAIATVVPML